MFYDEGNKQAGWLINADSGEYSKKKVAGMSLAYGRNSGGAISAAQYGRAIQAAQYMLSRRSQIYFAISSLLFRC